MMKTFVLLSDIHACNVSPEQWDAPSFVSSNNPKASGKTDPLFGLDELLSDLAVNPDYFLCAGDITNRSEPSAFTYAWGKLNDLANKHSAKLVATVGNHDIDSRFKENKYDPKGYAMSLIPKLPVEERKKFLEYWAENFTLLESQDNCSIMLLNTAAYHGYGSDSKIEVEHGRITDITILNIAERLKSKAKSHINILLCHHHPIKDQGDSDLVGQTRGGEQLISLLENAEEPWIIVHGHKHIPDLFYGHGGSNAPVILGCASFSAQITDTSHRNPNQVHILTCEGDVSHLDPSVSVAGTVRSWNWMPGVGWAKAAGLAGLPHEAGFGYRGNPLALVNKVEAKLLNSAKPWSKWNEMILEVPQLKWLTPTDFKKLEGELKKKSIEILTNDDTRQIGIEQ